MKSLYESIFDTNFEPTVDNTKVKPRSKAELEQIIAKHIRRVKPHPGEEVDLNWIDISRIDDLSELFANTNYIPVIDKWKIDQVEDFYHMFSHNKHITRSPLPVLQKKPPTKECYIAMFYDCTSLVEPPKLPATELTEYCYAGMFYGCTSLKVAPELPAMKLKKGCYTEMFQMCTSLIQAPELPAEELASHCYRNMFDGCSSLVQAPELPAKNLVPRCYEEMFKNCSSLKAKAKIPKGSVPDIFTAQDMYKGCPKIK